MTRILGVDFSGASDAGRKIWVAEGQPTDKGELMLSHCVPAMNLLAGASGRSRQCLPSPGMSPR